MSYSSEVLADSPLAYWRLGEPSGITAADASGNGRAGTYGGIYDLGLPGPVAGDTSFRSRSASGRVHVAGAAWMDVPTWTVEAWVRSPTLVAGNGKRILTREASATPVANNYVWSLRFQNNKLDVVVFSGGTAYFYPSTVTIMDDVWHHIAVSYDGTTIRIYVDGAAAGTATPPGPIARSTSSPIVIANAVDTVGNSYSYSADGIRVDEVAFYSGALSATRIAAHHLAASESAGSLSGVLPALSGSISAASPTSGALAGSLPGLAADFSGSSPETGVLSAVLPGLAGSIAGVAQVLVPTASTYSNYGYGYTGVGTVDYTPPIAATPARVRRVKVQHVHQSLPAPTLENGRPV